MDPSDAPPEPPAPAPPAPVHALRLAFSAAGLSALAAASAPASTPAPRAKNTSETWYDTAALTLLRHGYGLSTGKTRRGHVQTLRRGAEMEICATAAIPSALPDPAAFAPEWAEPLAALLAETPLAPAFGIRTRSLTYRTGAVELRFETGCIQTATEKLPFHELVLSGPDTELYQQALALAAANPLLLQPATPAQRGIWAVGATRPAAVKAGPGLTEDISLDAAITRLTQSCLTQFTANWAAFGAGPATDAVHQMRVAMRRLRSVLGLFNRAFAAPEFEALRAEARCIANVMGEARDWDVFTALLREGPLEALPHEPGFAAILTQCAAFRATGYAAVRALLADPATTRFLLSAELFLARHGWRNGLAVEDLARLAGPARDFAAANLDRLHRKVRKRGRHLTHSGPHERHLTRIELKKLRYAAELFGGLFARGKVRAYTSMAAQLQEELGLLNDLATAESLLARLDGTTPDETRAIGIVLGWCSHAARADARPLAKRWKAFTQSRPFSAS